ncbi:unnamed protein product [Pneumocystis jirovecii]|uniref:DUF1746 domain-containing protein n=1 Tax=Pneumocystis jirovecii TaxID=42068 RepID=L0P7I3_PNEJI|nr:unnamed protein product [Pneumocystis jirovecii]
MTNQDKFPEVSEDDLVNFHKSHFNDHLSQFFNFFLEKNEENICKNANFLEPIKYPDGQYGYLHGGIFINFVGEVSVHHCRFKSCFFDFIILFLQLFILNIRENASDIILDDLLDPYEDEIE